MNSQLFFNMMVECYAHATNFYEHNREVGETIETFYRDLNRQDELTDEQHTALADWIIFSNSCKDIDKELVMLATLGKVKKG